MTETLKAYDAGILNGFGGGDVEWWLDYIRAELARAHDHYVEQALALLPSSGWRLVPEEPTREMWAAMGDAFYGYRNRHHDRVSADFWKAALAASPKPLGEL